MSREERIDRQALDDGDPEDTVWIKIGGMGGDGNGYYHNERGCAALKSANNVDDATRQEAKERWRAPCGKCTVDLSVQNGGESR